MTAATGLLMSAANRTYKLAISIAARAKAAAMARFPFDVVAFDLDGTLADTAPDLAAALNHALAALGRPAVPADSVRHLIGHGGRALLRRGLAATGEAPEALVEAGYPLFLDYYGAHICDGTAALSAASSRRSTRSRRRAPRWPSAPTRPRR